LVATFCLKWIILKSEPQNPTASFCLRASHTSDAKNSSRSSPLLPSLEEGKSEVFARFSLLRVWPLSDSLDIPDALSSLPFSTVGSSCFCLALL